MKISILMKRLSAGICAAAAILCTHTMPVKAYTAHTQAEAVNWANGQIGQGLDYDHMYGNQCVDLIKYYYKYLADVETYGNACHYAYNDLPVGWTRVYGDYQPGDIAVWKVNHRCSTCTTDENGHVGIIMSADSVGFNAVNQNSGNKDYCTQNWFYISALQCAIRPDFPAAAPAPVPTPVPAPENADIYYSDEQTTTVLNNTGTTTGLYGEIHNPNRVTISQCGVRMWDSSGRQFVDFTEDISPEIQNYVLIKQSYAEIINVDHLTNEPLIPGADYSYEFFAISGGREYKSKKMTFQAIDNENPAISNVQISDIGEAGYTVSCIVTDNGRVARVQFPTWTEANGQDDIQQEWGTNAAASGTNFGSTYTYRVNIADHNGEMGLYHTHIYAYDLAGNAASVPAPDTNVAVKNEAAQEYIITFDANGGTDVPESQQTYGQKLTSFPASERDGYDFQGWYTSASGGDKITLQTSFGADTTVYAQWAEKVSDNSQYKPIQENPLQPEPDPEKPDQENPLQPEPDPEKPNQENPLQPEPDPEKPDSKTPGYVPVISLLKVSSPSKGKMKVSWQRYTGYGCQIAFSKNINFPKAKTTVKNVSSSNQKTFQRLSKGKVYYVRVRAYAETDKGKDFGAWSKVKKVKIKK